ncbi:ABC transporter permease [Diplocloster modestus]|uniref:ABC transporter permease n=1 Tax=Diplocloster modestus TaxID=2850322 RepID=A0ABS6K708_9FIRM|nr:ABC transporter permease [Diplocloster modestus]
MFKKILRRLALTLIVLVGVTIIAFALVRLAPGDPAVQMLPATATQEQIDNMRTRMGLDQSYVVQYFMYIGNLLKGDLGYSFHFNMDCGPLILSRLLNTAKITVIGVIIALIISIPLGLVAGIKRGSALDTCATAFALCGQAMSPVWLCLLMILIFSVGLKWLPTQGVGSWKNMVMPSLCVGFAFCSLVTRMLRSSMIDVLQEEYITATRARGVSKFQVYVKYAFKNAILPIVTISGAQLGILLCGSMVIEQIFNWPGLGQLTVTAISSRDFQLVQSILLIVAVIMVVCNLIVDILYTFIDKRISFN